MGQHCESARKSLQGELLAIIRNRLPDHIDASGVDTILPGADSSTGTSLADEIICYNPTSITAEVKSENASREGAFELFSTGGDTCEGNLAGNLFMTAVETVPDLSPPYSASSLLVGASNKILTTCPSEYSDSPSSSQFFPLGQTRPSRSQKSISGPEARQRTLNSLSTSGVGFQAFE
ncbi:unnamed protein product [Protopolystoma xenopodis]|uniref:Uncharacterized protein n=1 Tax=Protopolystoma xenopodis TaxID=117903 RepID=A0A3S5A0S3_9PLAT|nr:unnamed protein product [Protopolystoma xenopodis]